MTLFEYLERVKEHFPERGRTRIVLDLNRKVADFCRETKLITAREDLFSQALVDSGGHVLVTERDEEIACPLYGREFPLPWDAIMLTGIDEASGILTYRLEHGILTFYRGGGVVDFPSGGGYAITLNYVKRPRALAEDGDEPECHEDFHEGPLMYLLADYAAGKDKAMASYWLTQGELKKQEARSFATSLRRQSFDVKPFDWRT